MPIFKPSQIAHSLYEIDRDALKEAGIKGIILDWKNTLTNNKYDFSLDLLKTWMEDLQCQYPIKLIIVSNSKRPTRNWLVNEIPALFEAGKPKKEAFFTALDILGTSRNETAVIGNGIITDIWGGNRLGMYTIFVSHSCSKPRFIGSVKLLFVKMLRV
jgi:HAD superfamily phosphatase (TIGR01668 family)